MGKVYHLHERLANREFQGLDASEVSDKVIEPPGMVGVEVDEHKDILANGTEIGPPYLYNQKYYLTRNGHERKRNVRKKKEISDRV